MFMMFHPIILFFSFFFLSRRRQFIMLVILILIRKGITWKTSYSEKFIFSWWESRWRTWSLRSGGESQLGRVQIHTWKPRHSRNLSWWMAPLLEVRTFFPFLAVQGMSFILIQVAFALSFIVLADFISAMHLFGRSILSPSIKQYLEMKSV